MTSQRLQQIATTTPKAFPSPDTIRGLARGLRVSESVVVLAVAESLGLDVSRAVPRLVELLPATAMSISDRQAAAIAEVIRSFTEKKAGDGDDRDAAPIDAKERHLQGVVLATGSGKTEAVAQAVFSELAVELGREKVKVPEKLVRIAVRTALDAGRHPELYEDIAARETTE